MNNVCFRWFLSSVHVKIQFVSVSPRMLNGYAIRFIVDSVICGGDSCWYWRIVSGRDWASVRSMEAAVIAAEKPTNASWHCSRWSRWSQANFMVNVGLWQRHRMTTFVNEETWQNGQWQCLTIATWAFNKHCVEIQSHQKQQRKRVLEWRRTSSV